MLALSVAVGPLVMTTMGFFMGPISKDFGWTRGQVSAALTTCCIAAAVTSPFLGRLIDRLGLRKVVIPALIAFCLSVMSIGFSPASLITFYILFAITGVLSNAANTVPHMKAVASWFDEKRGLAIGITASGIGLGGIFLPVFTQHMITSYGWRAAYIGLGVLAAAVSVPAVLLSLRMKTQEAPHAQGKDPEEPGHVPGLTTKDARKRPAFWIICFTTLLVGTIINGLQVHTVPLLTDGGLDMAATAALVALLGFSSLTGRVVGGYLLDKFHAPKIAAFFFLVPIISLALMLNGLLLPLAVVLLGVSIGLEVDLMGFLVSRYLGLRSFGELFGFVMSMFVLGAAFGPLLFGTIFDATGGYTAALPVVGTALVVASVSVLFLGKYQYHPHTATNKTVTAEPVH